MNFSAFAASANLGYISVIIIISNCFIFRVSLMTQG